MKVPIDTLPVELRIKIYELGDISTITETTDDHPYWSRTIILSGILNDNDAVEIAAIQGDETRKIICSCIAISGNLPMMKWARSGKASLNVYTDAADAMDDDRSMKQIRLTPCPWNYACCRNAVHFGHFKLLQWLHEQGCPWDYWTFESAVHHGNFEMMEWLYQKKCPLEVSIFSYAVERGNLDVMKWLYERKFPWNESVCASAAMHGNLEILQWLRERGCPWDRETLDNAMCVRNYDLHHWAIWNGCPRFYRR
jgi:hypothetical protein